MKEKFNYPLEMMKDRKKILDNGNLSIHSYNILLKQIGVDIYDSINNLKEWNSFTIKGSLYVRSALGIFIPRKRGLRKMILLGLDSGKIAFDNYKRVLEGLDITNDTRSLSDLKILIEQQKILTLDNLRNSEGKTLIVPHKQIDFNLIERNPDAKQLITVVDILK